MVTAVSSADVLSRTCKVTWSFPAGSGLQEGDPFNGRGWEIVSAQVYTSNDFIPLMAIQISNEASPIAQADVSGLTIASTGVPAPSILLQPEAGTLVSAPSIRAIVDGFLSPNGATIVAYLRASS